MSSSIADRDTYVLMKRFDMPDGNGTRDAFAVTSSHGLILVSFYTIMIKAIITQFWTGIVLFGVGLFLKRHPDHSDSDSSSVTTTIGLWNVKHSPERVAYFTARRAIAARSYRDLGYPLIWLAVSAIALAASLAVPIVKTQDIRIGSVAPVNPNSIFALPLVGTVDQQAAQAYSLAVPAALRAVGAAATVPANTLFTSNVSTSSVNGTVVQFSYKYGVSGSDFGLQKTPDLWLNVSGSCITDYTLYQGNIDGIDTYSFYGINVSITPSGDNGPPYAIPVAPGNWNGFNYTYGLFPASLSCQSFTESTDPWYLTTSQDNSGFPYIVLDGRPALSCWEEDIWSFRGNTSLTYDLNNNTGNRLSEAVTDVLFEYLNGPMITLATQLLGRSSLESSTTVFGAGFNANQSSIVADMNRLVNTSYIATRNILSDSTKISQLGRDGLTNGIATGNDSILPRANEFVISSSNIYTLSVRVLIIVPAVLFGVLALLLVLAVLPDPWRSTKDLNATRLHKLRKHKHTSKVSKDKETVKGGLVNAVVGAAVDVEGDGGDNESQGVDDKITSA